jgi:hypothetical protein
VILSDLAAIVIVVAMTAIVVVVVIGLHVWGAIQDGREEKEMKDFRHGRPDSTTRGRR